MGQRSQFLLALNGLNNKNIAYTLTDQLSVRLITFHYQSCLFLLHDLNLATRVSVKSDEAVWGSDLQYLEFGLQWPFYGLVNITYCTFKTHS